MGLILIQPKYRRPSLIFTGVVLAALFCRLGFSRACCTEPAAPAPVVSPGPSVKAAQREPLPALLTHPILRTPQFSGLNGRKLDPSVFKELNSIKYEDGLKYRGVGFEQAEFDAAYQFCDLVKDKTASQIQKQFGKPSVTKLHKSNCRCFDFDRRRTVWIYYLGYNLAPVELLFQDGICLYGTSCNITGKDAGLRTSVGQKEGFYVGRTLSDILATDGESCRIVDPRTEPKIVYTNCAILTPTDHPDFLRADKIVTYCWPSENRGLMLAIKDGRCIKAMTYPLSCGVD